MHNHTLFVGLDVSLKTIDVSFAEPGRCGEIRRYGEINYDMTSVGKLARKLVSQGRHPSFVYEAGPWGFELYRFLNNKGFDCSVVGPSMIPKKSGDKIKTDPRDSMNLARLHRSGELGAIYVPTEEDEAIRDLIRAREDAVYVQTKARQRVTSFLWRHGKVFPGKTRWGCGHLRWLAAQKFPHVALDLAYQEYLNAVEEAQARVQRFTQLITDQIKQWRFYSIVRAFMAYRGVRLIIAATVIAELGDLSRFKSAKQLMGFLGLVPSESTSGPTRRLGPITKSGNAHVRRVLIEAAWSYRYRPRVSDVILRRQKDQPQHIKDLAWKAQVRLTGQYRKLHGLKGKPKQVVVVALARELAGFLWATYHLALGIDPNAQTP